MSSHRTIRVVTYNVHKCRGLDRRIRPDRIVALLREINADIVALQEVLCVEDKSPQLNQARYLAEALECEYHVGENRRLRGGAYGNVTLSRLPLRNACNYDISWWWHERRGCLRADVELGHGGMLHVFNVHLGTSFLERRQQARRLMGDKILTNPELAGARLVLGDFNEWTRGLATSLLGAHLQSADIRHHLRRRRTYPGVFPLLHLDHVYFDDALELERLTLFRSRAALVASDHLPLVADFRFTNRSS